MLHNHNQERLNERTETLLATSMGEEMNNDPKLKLAMARLLPEKIFIDEEVLLPARFYWKAGVEENGILKGLNHVKHIRETEWLYVIHLVEPTLEHVEKIEYIRQLHPTESTGSAVWNDWFVATSDFNQRATAMCKLKGITI